METLLALSLFTFGIIIGSFLNVVIYRYNTGATIGGRSMCMSCGSQLTWKELIPVLSFLMQNGKCRVCSCKISWQYPLVELFTATLFLFAYFVFDITPFLIYILIQLAILVVITVYDLRHKIIPNLFVYSFSGLALLMIVGTGFITGNWDSIIIDVLAGPIFFTPFALLWYFSKGQWMGFGDAKLVLGIGWFLGIADGYLALILAFWTGALVGLIMMGIGHIQRLSLGGKKITMQSEIPFGPFLILGMLLVLFARPWLYDWLSIVIFW